MLIMLIIDMCGVLEVGNVVKKQRRKKRKADNDLSR